MLNIIKHKPIIATIIAFLLICFIGAAAAISLVPEINWRARVIAMKLSGGITGLSWTELSIMLRPGSEFYLKSLAKTGNAYSVIVNPHKSEIDINAGSELFRSKCAVCHGSGTHGAPDLSQSGYRHGESDWATFRSITRGIRNTQMFSQDVEEIEAWQLVAYLQSLRTKGEKILAPSSMSGGELSPITPERLLRANDEPGSWLSYSRNYTGQRHSALTQITNDNVEQMSLRWAYQMSTAETMVETSPIVVDGAMYVTEPPNNVIALDAHTGKERWKYQRRLPNGLPICCGRVNRGLAALDQRLYLGTLDARLVALDMRSGKLVWETVVAEPALGFSITAAPLVVKDKVIMGVSGGEYGIRGFLDAYDAKTGSRAWRFYTVPGPGEVGNESWEEDSWKTGGGPTWMTGSFDPELNLIYWGVGNPGPVFQGDIRKGDNLFTNSIVALDADNGIMKWHFQATPHDEWDYDLNVVPILVDAEFGNKRRNLIVFKNKNGFYYVLDRKTGEFLKGKPFAKTTWAKELDSKGRPKIIPGSAPSDKGTLGYPSAGGASNWWPASYSPLTNLVYLPVLEKGSIFFKAGVDEPAERERGKFFLGSASQGITNEGARTFVRAVELTTGDLRWEFAFPPRSTYGIVGGVLSTAGGVVFVGDYTKFYAFDAATGEKLWHAELGGNINAPPITFMSGGEQFVTIAAGRTLFTFGLLRSKKED